MPQSKKTVVDFSNTDSGNSRVRIPEDNYRAKVKTVKHETSKAGNPMLVWEFEIAEGKFKGRVLIDRTVLQENSLWKLKQLLEAMGITVPSKRIALDLSRYPGRELGISVVDDEYEGRISSKVGDYMDVDVLDGGDIEDDEEEDEEEDEDEEQEEEEEPAPRQRARKSRKAAPKDEEEIEDLDLDSI
jgi:hypothetical protein